ncbi:MAG: hypothetical protein JWO20_2942 [Candidatus Angelobacter sp.]|jgi:hypothetical protein|nr:hypothetical protein [Candidatus Angelobacter sp.]
MILCPAGAKIKGTLPYSMTYPGKLAVLILSVLGSNLVLSAQAKELPKQPVVRKHLTAAGSKKSKPSAIVPAPAPLPQVPVFTPAPLRPGQMPAVAPRISYQGGQLTIVAENSNFSDVLSGIRTATGLRIESTGGTGGERVAAKIGPASVRDVLLSLLQGSRYDFIMMGSATDPDRIERVLLSPKAAAVAAANGATQPAAAAAQDAAQDESETDNSDDNAGFAPAPAQPPTALPPGPGAAAAPNGQTAASPDASQGVKTPEQLLQDLRNMQQQQQQQQQTTPTTSPDQVQRPARTPRPPQ